jgi:hypothetical protein
MHNDSWVGRNPTNGGSADWRRRRQRCVKKHKEAIQMFTVVKNLHGTVRVEEIDGSEYELYICCAPANYEFSIFYVQIVFV